MNKFSFALMAAMTVSGPVMADTWVITVTNDLEDELLAPIVATSAANDQHFFLDGYVTAAAEKQILTGDPAAVVESIGAEYAVVGHGEDGPPGVLLAPGASVTFEFETDATTLRLLAMVAPTEVPDNYVTNVVDVHGLHEATVALNRYDIGNDEQTRQSTMTGKHSASVLMVRK